jgi:GR25 family glycosyltransferase involved in LPS biosynthesis
MVKNCLIINLDERTDLWKNLEVFREQWTKLGKTCERIQGVSYKNKTNVLNEYITNGKINILNGGFRNQKQAFLGELGCYMGHYNAWKQIVENKVESCLIMEDGVRIIRSDFNNLTMPNTLDILYVNAEMELHPIYPVFGYGLQGYVVTYEGANNLLKECAVLRMPIDLQLLNLCNNHIIKATAMTAPYVIRDDNRTSSIDGTKLREVNDKRDTQTIIREKQNKDSLLQRIVTNLLKNNVNLDELL